MTLESLALGSLTLTPSFDADTESYATTYQAPSDLSETVTVTAEPTSSTAQIEIYCGDASADPSTYTKAGSDCKVHLYAVGASMSRKVLVVVKDSGHSKTYQIGVTVTPYVGG